MRYKTNSEDREKTKKRQRKEAFVMKHTAHTIARGGNALYKIILPADASDTQNYAASELRYYLGLITAASFEITSGGLAPALYIGDRPDASLGEDGLTVKTDGAGLHINGGRRGVIYGVYEFLEQADCRFFTALCEKIPAQPDFTLPELDIRQIPVLEYREHNYSDLTKYTRFAVKSRLNGAHHRIKPKHGGNLSYAWYVHSFERMVPPEIYYDEHPEYYALSDGERRHLYQRFQLCLTNPGVLEVSVESVRTALKANPQAKIISISQNDWHGNCECDSCLAADREEGSPAGTLLRFVNAIAERLEPEFPDILFDTLAYNYTRPAPSLTRPRHNVCVRLCSIESCFAHPFESCDDEKRAVKRPDGSVSSFITDLEDWGKICGRMYIWDYTTCFAHYPTPHPNWNVLGPNMRAFVKNNVKGVFEQACGASGGSTDLNELRAYVISKLLWDCNADTGALITEFTDYYYGAAGVYIREYIKTLTDKAEGDNIHVGFNDQPLHAFLCEEMLDVYDTIFDRAEKAVRGDALRLYRVKKARLSIRWVRIKRKAMLQNTRNAEEIGAFFTDWQAFGLTRIDEWVSPQTTCRALLDNKWRGTEYYGHWSDEGGEEL
jgi:hypothetical protein